MRYRMIHRLGLAIAICLLVPAAAAAHVVTNTYVLPVPFWMYLYGCVAMLIVSFGVLGYFWTSDPHSVVAVTTRDVNASAMGGVGRATIGVLRLGAVAALVLTIATGFLGTSDPTRNPNLSLFW